MWNLYKALDTLRLCRCSHKWFYLMSKDKAVAKAALRWSMYRNKLLLCHCLSFPEKWLTSSLCGVSTSLSAEDINTHSQVQSVDAPVSNAAQTLTYTNTEWHPAMVHGQKDLVPWTCCHSDSLAEHTRWNWVWESFLTQTFLSFIKKISSFLFIAFIFHPLITNT